MLLILLCRLLRHLLLSLLLHLPLATPTLSPPCSTGSPSARCLGRAAELPDERGLGFSLVVPEARGGDGSSHLVWLN